MSCVDLCEDILCVLMDRMYSCEITNLRQVKRDFHCASERLARSKVGRLHNELFVFLMELEQLRSEMEEIEIDFEHWYDEEDNDDEITEQYDPIASEWISFLSSTRDNLLKHYRKFAFNSDIRSLLCTASAVLQTAANTFDPWKSATFFCKANSKFYHIDGHRFERHGVDWVKYSTVKSTPFLCDETLREHELRKVLEKSSFSEGEKSIMYEYISQTDLILVCSILRCQEQDLPVVFPCNPIENGDALESALINQKAAAEKVEQQRRYEQQERNEEANRERRFIAEKAITEGTPLPSDVYKYMQKRWKGCLPSCGNCASRKNRFRACTRCANKLLAALSNQKKHVSE